VGGKDFTVELPARGAVIDDDVGESTANVNASAGPAHPARAGNCVNSFTNLVSLQ